ncbi:hypothetical protein CRM22_007559 [Opisthorchis felineus]|uniref:F5/8 type C domain-containing protein n=1 Tax=Opisthorchis felineus TaxID=147828 RepID=A0A4S2LFY4_OPIFE|nr:hypothetical protein CRM22_007559 [Opisthorchis felineus]
MLSFSSHADKFIRLATSLDEQHPPENVLDNDEKSFWITTGMFPQMLVLSLTENTKVGNVTVISSCIKNMWVEVSSHPEPEEFDLKSELTIPYTDGHLQITEIRVNEQNMRHLRLTIRSGYDHFVAVYKVLIDRK